MVKNLKGWVSPAVIAVLAITAFQAEGVERTWDGGQPGTGNNILWNKNKNWSDNTLPGVNDTAVFAAGTIPSQPTLDADSSVQGVAFRRDGWTVSSGGAFTLTTGTGGIVDTSGTGTNTVAAAIALGASQSWSVAAGGTLVVSSVVSGGTNSLTKTGDGTLRLTGASTYTGGTIVNEGTLHLSGSANRLSATGAITVNGGTLNLGGFSQSTSGVVQITGGTVSSGTISKSGANYDVQGGTISATLAGAVGLDKTGDSAATLSGNNSYIGATTVSAGTLLVDGSIASAVSVSSGATLGGHGTVGEISGAGTVGPGNSPGILTATSVNGAGGLDFNFEFTQAVSGGVSQPNFNTASASGNDLLRLTGNTPFDDVAFTAANVITINLSGLTLNQGDVLYGGFYADIGGDFFDSIEDATFNYVGLADGFTIGFSTTFLPANFEEGASNGYITTFTVVPEPTTAALLGFAVGGLLIAVRRRKTAKVAA